MNGLDLLIGADTSLGFAITCNRQNYSLNRKAEGWWLDYIGPESDTPKLPELSKAKVSGHVGSTRIDWTEALKRALVNIQLHQEES